MFNRQPNTFIFVFLTIIFVLVAVQPALAVDSITGEAHDSLKMVVQGDFNGDNYPDVAACSSNFDYEPSLGSGVGAGSTGGVNIFWGTRIATASGTVSVSTADAILSGVANDHAGTDCAVGDVNGDGIDDIVVGASTNVDGATMGGAVYAVLGSSTLASSPLSMALQFTGEADADYAGFSVATGDVNGDSIDDIIVGASGNNDAGIDAGAVYVVLGSATLASASLSTAIKFTGESTEDEAGYFMLATGDVNGDSIDDIIVGAHGNDDGGVDAGAAYVVLGSATLASSSLSTAIQFTGETEDYESGSSVATGDVNDDGIDDIIIGGYDTDGYSHDGGASTAGNVYVVFGSATLAASSLSTAVQLAGEAAGDGAGFSVATGDMNADGIDDIIVGACCNGSAGAAYVVLGRSTWRLAHYALIPGLKIRKFMGKVAGDYLGTFVGYFERLLRHPRLILGSRHNDDGGDDAGQVWLIRTLPGSAEGYQRTLH